MRRAALPVLVVAIGATGWAVLPERPEPPPAVVLGRFARSLVHYEHTVWNPADVPLRDVVCEALLPCGTERQRVRWLRLSPHGWELRTDSHGQRFARAVVREIAPGDAVSFGWIASVDLAAATHDLAATGADDPRASAYRGDATVLGLTSSAVGEAAEEARRDACGEAATDLARAALEVVRRRVRYERAGGWDPAPRVLERGSGSCSESVFSYMAVCRRLGLASRWVGGSMHRAGPPGRALDQVFHRVAEVHLPGHGWAPAEATGSEDGVAAEDLGRLPRGFLTLGRGDGGGDAATGVVYPSRHAWTEPKRTKGEPRRGRAAKRAWWLGAVDDGAATAGGLDGLEPGHAPSFPRGELIACDALGYGAAVDAHGAKLGAAPSKRPSLADAAELLLRAGHPEALRLAVLAARVDPAQAERLTALAEACCSERLCAEFLPLLGGTPAEFETWWDARDSAVTPRERGLLDLAETR